jgi:hypothetical protein
MSDASANLKTNQRQLDMDGCEVGVSRQAVEETLEEYALMLAALEALRPYFEGEHAYDHPHCVQMHAAIKAATGGSRGRQPDKHNYRGPT